MSNQPFDKNQQMDILEMTVTELLNGIIPLLDKLKRLIELASGDDDSDPYIPPDPEHKEAAVNRNKNSVALSKRYFRSARLWKDEFASQTLPDNTKIKLTDVLLIIEISQRALLKQIEVGLFPEPSSHLESEFAWQVADISKFFKRKGRLV